MKTQSTSLNGEQLNKTNVLASTLLNDSVSSPRINLGLGGENSIKFGVKPLGTSLPRNKSRKEFKPPVKTIKFSDYLPKGKK